MSGRQEARLVELVDQARPRAIEREADEWQRRATVLEDAVRAVEAAAARHPEIGGSTGPALAQALAVAADALAVKARDLHRGSQALREVAHATEEATQERQRVDQRHPRQQAGAEVLREEDSRKAADTHEEAFRRGIATMKDIQVGRDPRTATIPVEERTRVEDPTGWRPPEDDEDGGRVGLHPGDPEWDDPEDLPGDGVGLGTVALGGAGAIGLAAGATAVARAAAASGAPAAVTGKLGGMAAGAPAVLGGVGGGAGAAAGARGAPAAGGGLGSSARRAAGTGGLLGGARRGGRTKEEPAEGERDLHDDGDGWLDDEGGPGILR